MKNITMHLAIAVSLFGGVLLAVRDINTEADQQFLRIQAAYNLTALRTAAISENPNTVAYFEALLKAQMLVRGDNPSQLIVTPIR